MRPRIVVAVAVAVAVAAAAASAAVAAVAVAVAAAVVAAAAAAAVAAAGERLSQEPRASATPVWEGAPRLCVRRTNAPWGNLPGALYVGQVIGL